MNWRGLVNVLYKQNLPALFAGGNILNVNKTNYSSMGSSGVSII